MQVPNTEVTFMHTTKAWVRFLKAVVTFEFKHITSGACLGQATLAYGMMVSFLPKTNVIDIKRVKQSNVSKPQEITAEAESAAFGHSNKIQLYSSLTIKFRVSLSSVCIPHGDETPLHSNRVVHGCPNTHAPIINISACTKKKTGVRQQLQ